MICVLINWVNSKRYLTVVQSVGLKWLWIMTLKEARKEWINADRRVRLGYCDVARTLRRTEQEKNGSML
jgi:hypothetical protein